MSREKLYLVYWDLFSNETYSQIGLLASNFLFHRAFLVVYLWQSWDIYLSVGLAFYIFVIFFFFGKKKNFIRE